MSEITIEVLCSKRGDYRGANIKGDVINLYWLVYHAYNGIKENEIQDPEQIEQIRKMKDYLEQYAYYEKENKPSPFGSKITLKF